MSLSDTRTKLIAAAIALAAIGLIYLAWTRMKAQTVRLPAGQTLANPYGNTPPPMSVNLGPGAAAPPASQPR